MDLSETGDGAEVGLIARRQNPERDVLHQPLLDAARTEDPYAVSVDKNLGHHQGIVRRLATLLVSVNRLHRRQIQVVHHVAYEIRQVVFRQPVTQAGRQQQLFFT